MSLLIPGTEEIEKAAEKAEDHLTADVTQQMIPALVGAIDKLLSRKTVKVTLTLTVEEKVSGNVQA